MRWGKCNNRINIVSGKIWKNNQATNCILNQLHVFTHHKISKHMLRSASTQLWFGVVGLCGGALPEDQNRPHCDWWGGPAPDMSEAERRQTEKCRSPTCAGRREFKSIQCGLHIKDWGTVQCFHVPHDLCFGLGSVQSLQREIQLSVIMVRV